MPVRDVWPPAALRDRAFTSSDVTRYAWLGDHRALVLTFFGRRLILDTRLIHQYSIITHGIYEPPLGVVFDELLRPGDAFVDVGANVGYHTVYAAHLVGHTGAVFCFEPNPEVSRILQDNVTINAMGPWVTVFPKAVGEAEGVAELSWREGEHAGGTLYRAASSGVDMRSAQVAVTTLDKELSSFERPIRLMKLDAEGYEIFALKGGEALLARNPAMNVILEWNPRMTRSAGHDPLEAVAWLRKHFKRVRRLVSVKESPEISFDELVDIRHANLWLDNEA